MTETPIEAGPRRLKDDPDFRWETGCDLADETLVTSGYDLARGRARLLAAVAAAPLAASGPPSAGVAPGAHGWRAWLRPLAGIAGGVALLGGGFWLGVTSRGPVAEAPIADPPPIAAPEAGAPEAPVPADAAPASADAASGPADGTPADGTPADGTPADGTPAGAAPALAVVPPGAAPPAVTGPATGAPIAAAPAGPVEVVGDVTVEVGSGATVEVDGDAAAGVEVPTGPGTDPVRASTLAAEMADFDRIDESLGRGDPAGAVRAADVYLADWPSGRLATEARFKRLLAVLATGDASAAERQAADLQDRPEFAARRAEILRVRAESLVSLDRCGEALALTGLASRDAAEVRRACRHRESP